MPEASGYNDIAHVIQLSVAPVFLLVAIGSLLNVMTSRLGRVVDRARVLEAELGDAPKPPAHRIRELKALDRRMSYSNLAINLSALAALLIAFVVALLFLGDLAGGDTSSVVAILFVLTMVVIIAALIAFLAEISVATSTVRVNADLLKR